MLFDKRTVLCAFVCSGSKAPTDTLVRAPTLFVIETQYTPKRSGADHITTSTQTVQCIKMVYTVSSTRAITRNTCIKTKK